MSKKIGLSFEDSSDEDEMQIDKPEEQIYESEAFEPSVTMETQAPETTRPIKKGFKPNLKVKRNKKQVDDEVLMANVQQPIEKETRSRIRRNDADMMIAQGPLSMGPATMQQKGKKYDAAAHAPIGGVYGHKKDDLIPEKSQTLVSQEDLLDLQSFDPFAKYEQLHAAQDHDERFSFDPLDIWSPVRAGGLEGGIFADQDAEMRQPEEPMNNANIMRSMVSCIFTQNKQLLLFQFPNALPSLIPHPTHDKKESKKDIKRETKHHVKQELEGREGLDPKLHGQIGKLIYYKNGTAKMKIAFPEPRFQSSIAAIDLTPLGNTDTHHPRFNPVLNQMVEGSARDQKRCYFLGDIGKRFVCTPDVGQLLRDQK